MFDRYCGFFKVKACGCGTSNKSVNLQANEGRQDTLKDLLWEMRASCIKDAQLTAEGIQKRINYIPWTDKMEKESDCKCCDRHFYN